MFYYQSIITLKYMRGKYFRMGLPYLHRSRYLLTKYETLKLQEFSSAVVYAELRAAQCVFDQRSSSYCLMLDNCRRRGSNSRPSDLKAIVLSTPPRGTHHRSRYLLTKYKTLQLQEFSSAVVCAELRAAQCVFDRRSSSYCLMLDPSSVCSCSDYWMCEWSVHGPGKIPKTDRKKGKLPSQLFSRSFFLFFFFGERVENQLLFWQARFIFNAVIITLALTNLDIKRIKWEWKWKWDL